MKYKILPNDIANAAELKHSEKRLTQKVALIAAVTLAMAGSAAAGRTWHVSPHSLPGLIDDSQVKTISEAVRMVRAGDTVIIHSGIYRETVVVDTSGTQEKPIRFQAAPEARVIITGADKITAWEKASGDGNVYSTPWNHRFIEWNSLGTHPADDFHKMIGRCEQVFIQNYPLLQVLEADKLSRGTFYVDIEAKRLLVCPRDNLALTNESAPLVEASTRSLLWHSKGQHIHLRGLHFRYAANMAQHGAALFEGSSGVIEDCVFEQMNSCGATVTGADLVFRRCTFRQNGQLGFGATRAHNLLLSECLVENNNTKGWNRHWEAGGCKLVLCRGVVLENSRFIANRGHGVWFDIGNEKSVVRNCLIADNEDAGIFYEISYGLNALDNVIVGNGFAETPGAWGCAAGISLSSSSNCIVERNLLVGNREGLNFREQYRKTPVIDDEQEVWIWNNNHVIRNNMLAYNHDAQIWGWFDVNDQRHWPAAIRNSAEKEEGEAGIDAAARYKIDQNDGAPEVLSLEQLALTIESNLYAVQPSQGLFHWGVPWKRHVKYRTLTDVQSELNLETGSAVTELSFADYLTRDYRVPIGSKALIMGSYPRGEVPGVKLGTTSR